jgi:V/A-type H+-transporting ATPase subunit D
MELQASRRLLTLAREGEDLLEEKRSALLRELMRTADRALTEGAELDQAAAVALESLHLAAALDGPQAVHSAALAVTATGDLFEVEIEGSMVLGVPVPRIFPRTHRRSPGSRGYSLAFSSARIDQVAATFEDELDCLVRVAETEARVRRLGDEIQRTSRRVNALRHVVIPALVRDTRRIADVLGEREREDHDRLRHLKRARAQGQDGGR